jgi:hypothetical protein
MSHQVQYFGVATAGFNIHHQWRQDMNKKLAILLFAMGLGATSTQAADSCGWTCLRTYQACIASGANQIDCELDRIDCTDRCGI